MSTTFIYYNRQLTRTRLNPLYLFLNSNRKLSSVNRNSKPSRFKKELKILISLQLITEIRNKYDKPVPPTSITGLTQVLEINKEKNLINRFTLLPREKLCIKIKAASWILLIDPLLAKKTTLISNKILTSQNQQTSLTTKMIFKNCSSNIKGNNLDIINILYIETVLICN